MTTVNLNERIGLDLIQIKNQAVTAEDGNTAALVDKMLRDLGYMNTKYYSLVVYSMEEFLNPKDDAHIDTLDGPIIPLSSAVASSAKAKAST